MSDIKLNIKRIEQKDNFDCSPACVVMIMSFYGDEISVSELETKLSDYVNKDERHIEASVIFLLEQGYDVFLQNYNQKVLGDNLINLTEEDQSKFEEEFNNLSEEKSFKRTKLDFTLKFIKNGGKLSTSKSNIEVIEKNLEKERPIIVVVNNAEFRQNS